VLGPAISYYLCMFTCAMSSETPVARSDFDEMTEGGKTVSPVIVASDLCPKVSKLGITCSVNALVAITHALIVCLEACGIFV